MSTPPFVALVDPTAGPLIPSLALVAPIIVPSTLLHAVLPTLPPNATYYVEATQSEEDLVQLLDAGASKIVVSSGQLKFLAGGVPRERLILQIDESELEAIKDLALSVSGIYFISATPHNPKSLDLPNTTVYLQPPNPSPLELASQISSARLTTFVLPTSCLTTGPTSTIALSIADALLASIVSDRPDGLFPTIVSSNLHSSRPLGLVYSSRESIAETIKSGRGVYQSRKHGLWRKGETSGATQEIVSIKLDCDSDALLFEVVQHGSGFCHLPQTTCFGGLAGVGKLEDTLKSRYQDAPEGSYTKRLFSDDKLLRSKIMEEAEELCDAQTKEEVAFEAADLIYFALTRCIWKGVGWADVEAALDKKALKVWRRKGDAKPKWAEKVNGDAVKDGSKATEPVPAPFPESTSADAPIIMRKSTLSTLNKTERSKLLLRPVLNSLAMIDKVKPIVERVRKEGDVGLKAMTKQFDKADLASNVIRPPFAVPSETDLPASVRQAIDTAYANVRTFHAAQAEKAPLVVTTMPGVVCSRFSRPITRVGLYVPGGTAVLPSTAIMLGCPGPSGRMQRDCSRYSASTRRIHLPGSSIRREPDRSYLHTQSWWRTSRRSNGIWNGGSAESRQIVWTGKSMGDSGQDARAERHGCSGSYRHAGGVHQRYWLLRITLPTRFTSLQISCHKRSTEPILRSFSSLSPSPPSTWPRSKRRSTSKLGHYPEWPSRGKQSRNPSLSRSIH